MCLFNWLTEYSSNILYIDFRIDLDQIRFHFEFFNLEFSVNIPLPFGCLVKDRNQQNISYKSFEFNKVYHGTLNRTLEIQTFIDHTCLISFSFQKHFELVDHDPYHLEACLFGQAVDLNLIHHWHVVKDDRLNYSDRFPTEEEAQKIDMCMQTMSERMFGQKQAPTFPQDKESKNLYDKYWKFVEDFKDKLFFNKKYTLQEVLDSSNKIYQYAVLDKDGICYLCETEPFKLDEEEWKTIDGYESINSLLPYSLIGIEKPNDWKKSLVQRSK